MDYKKKSTSPGQSPKPSYDGLFVRQTNKRGMSRLVQAASCSFGEMRGSMIDRKTQQLVAEETFEGATEAKDAIGDAWMFENSAEGEPIFLAKLLTIK